MSTWLEKQFHLKEYQTSARTEIIAGLTVCGVVDSYTWQGRTVQCH